MKEFINKIKQFFKNIISRNKKKQLEAPKDNNLEESSTLNKNQEENQINKLAEKEEFFEIYQKVKNGQYNLKELTEEQSKKIIAILNSEINLKKDKLEQNNTELNVLKIDNRIKEKNRIFELYNGIKNENINLSDIDREDLIKIRRLLFEESKIQNEKLDDEIKLLKSIKKVS